MRLVVPPLVVLLVGGGIALFGSRPTPAPDPADQEPPPGSGGDAKGGQPKFVAQPVHVEVLPRTESLAAAVSAPEAILLFSDLRAPFVEIPVSVGQAVRKGDLIARASTGKVEDALAAALERGDEKEADRLKASLAQAEIRAPADGILHILEIGLGDMPPPPGPKGPRPVAVLFDWTRIVLETSVPAALASLAREGAPVFLRIGDGAPVAGRFLRIDPPAADGSVAVAVAPLTPPGVTPGPGVEGEVLLPSGQKEGIVVPERALRREGGRTVVFEVGITGDLTPRPVGVGMRLPGGQVEITGVARTVSVAIFENPKGHE